MRSFFSAIFALGIRNFAALGIIAILLLAAAAMPLGIPQQNAYAGTFPGVNGKIAFESLRDGNPEIYVMNADGSGQTRLTDSPGFDRDPSWSPDGTKIAFELNESHATTDGEIYVMNADGSGQIQLTDNGAHDGNPSWSPDGTKIAFETTRVDNFNQEIFQMNIDGTLQSNLSISLGSDGEPDWGRGTAPTDTEAPIITAPVDITLECNTVGGFSGALSLGTAAASDNQDPSPVVTYTPNPLPSSVTFDGLTVTWTATDASGNSASDVQAVSVVDTTAPVLAAPPEIEVFQGQSTNPSATGQATATDICDSSVDVAYTDGALATDNTFVRTWTATDDHLNMATATQKIVVVIPVNIDIKPGNFPNSINLKKDTTISIAVLGSSTFDVKKAVVNTIKFGDLGRDPGASPKDNKGSYSDVNKDGFLDLTVKFNTPQTGIDQGDVEACLKGKLLSGAVFKGCDSVRTV